MEHIQALVVAVVVVGPTTGTPVVVVQVAVEFSCLIQLHNK
jgi:hypothetical protein